MFTPVARPLTRKLSLKLSNDIPAPIFDFAATPVMVFTMSWTYAEDELDRLYALFEGPQAGTAWQAIQGTLHDRWFIPGMREAAKDLYKQATLMLVRVLSMLYVMHPYHRQIAYGALKSASQNSLQELHTDYEDAITSLLQCHVMPFSVIVTFRDASPLHYINESGELIKLLVPPFSFVRFMGNVKHAGGVNETDKTTYRLFMYCTINPGQIPPNGFF